MTASPLVVCVFTVVAASVTDGVSATGVTAKLTVAVAVSGSAAPLVVPLSRDRVVEAGRAVEVGVGV